MAIDKSNPNTRRLVNYWVRGEGAAKIRWGTDGSFNRCVRNLADKVRDPKGLCAELHKEATGEWPAQEGVESATEDHNFFELTEQEIEDLKELNAAMPNVNRAPKGIRFRGLIAPVDKPTGDRRIFAPGALTHRTLPRPANFQIRTSSGHAESVTVAKLEQMWEGEGGWYGQGTFLDPRIVPEVIRAVYLLKEGVYGPSVDVDNVTYEIVQHPLQEDMTAVRFTRGRVMGLTFVSFPAFAEVEIMVDDPDQMDVLTAAGVNFAVNSTNWKRFPIGSRDQEWNADETIARLIEWSGGQPSKYRVAFLYTDDRGDATSRDTYRLPIADVVNGELTLIPHAVYAAAALLSGAHGGLPNIPDQEKDRLRDVITEIYAVLQSQWNDPRVKPPWLRGGRDARGNPTVSVEEDQVARFDADDLVVPAVEAVGAELSFEAGEPERSLEAATSPVKPPAAWFRDPQLSGPTPLTLSEDGRVYGHLAAWNVCHTGIGNRCIQAPRNITGYKHFKVGSVVLDNSQSIPVGKITLGGGHADPQLGYIPAAEHYDNSCTAVAVVDIGEDKHGVWVAGALVAGLSNERVAELRRSPLSGDWRRINGQLELVAALAVNNPGFPVIRASGMGHEEDGDDTVLAAGMVTVSQSTDAPVDLPELVELGRIARLKALDDSIAVLNNKNRRQRIDTIFAKEDR
jgi:hypothetical protein